LDLEEFYLTLREKSASTEAKKASSTSNYGYLNKRKAGAVAHLG
jgi:hypothetical protein